MSLLAWVLISASETGQTNAERCVQKQLLLSDFVPLFSRRSTVRTVSLSLHMTEDIYNVIIRKDYGPSKEVAGQSALQKSSGTQLCFSFLMAQSRAE